MGVRGRVGSDGGTVGLASINVLRAAPSTWEGRRMGVRVLGADDWATKRRLRLWALKESPRSFGSTYDREKNRGEAQWRTWPDAGAFFAAERHGDDIGIACGWRSFRDPGATDLI